MSAESRLAEIGVALPAPPRPVGSYVTLVTSGNLAFTSGHIPVLPDGSVLTGRVGLNLDAEGGREAARVVCLGILATLREHLGSLDRVARVVKVLGMVNCTPDFEDLPGVINGCSDLLVEVFGDAGRHARSAVGVASLPGNVPVEIEAVVEFE